MAKTIVYCADGTWNGTGSSFGDTSPDDEVASSRLTNVYKLFDRLCGEPIDANPGANLLSSLEKRWPSTDDPDPTQVAMYCHGVGDNHWLLSERVLGGAFGAGLTTRMRLGYDYISKWYRPGDFIVIAGFSRGAYTARGLADLIGAKGLLRSELTGDHGPFSRAAAAWISYRQQKLGTSHPDFAVHFEDVCRDFHEHVTFSLTDRDFVEQVQVSVVAVWDTVGAMGLPEYKANSRLDEFDFASERLGGHIARALHAVSLDEQRVDFQPTLWEPEQRVTQELFAGDHRDVGGGREEHGLSDVTLKWMLERLAQTGVPLRLREEPAPSDYLPDPLAPAHRQWTHGIDRLLAHHPRKFKPGYLTINEAVTERMKAASVIEDGTSQKYQPSNLPCDASR